MPQTTAWYRAAQTAKGAVEPRPTSPLQEMKREMKQEMKQEIKQATRKTKKETRWGSAEPQRVRLFTGSWQLCRRPGRIPETSYLFRRHLPNMWSALSGSPTRRKHDRLHNKL
jgi:hypothetical protein